MYMYGPFLDMGLTSVTLPCIMLLVLSPSLVGALDVDGEAVAGGETRDVHLVRTKYMYRR